MGGIVPTSKVPLTHDCKLVLVVGWKLSYGHQLRTLVLFYVGSVLGCLSFLTAWQLGSKSKYFKGQKAEAYNLLRCRS